MIYSFDPIDIGFDPRTLDMPVDLPEDATAVRYIRPGGDEVQTVAGTREQLRSALQAAGFEVL